VAGDDFDSVLRFLRSLATPCDPPVGVGAFDILYASEKEVVVWYSPARQEHKPGEVTIPSARLAAAWAALAAGDPLDEAALESLGAGPAGGRWLLALLVQVPGVRLREDTLALTWAPVEAPAPVVANAPVGIASPITSSPKPKTPRSRQRKPRATRP
jgi:hypothetical protein